MISDSFIEELKYRCSIEDIISPYTNLKRSGRNLSGLCPFHSEKTPSFVVYPESGSFYCFGCGVGGDVITFVRMAEHLEYIEALKFLADKAGVKMPEDKADDSASRLKMRILEANRETARYFHSCLISPVGKKGMDYFKARGLSDSTIKKFGLGYAPDSWDSLMKHLYSKGFTTAELTAAGLVRMNSRGVAYAQFRDKVMFPIIDLRGAVIAFGGRVLDDSKPKYINSSDTPVFKKSRGLFAMNLAKVTKRAHMILCEGYMDTIAMYQAGFDNAVASLGTAITPEQSRLISQYVHEVVLSYDSDVAGQKATKRAIELFEPLNVKVKVLSIVGAKDPDEYITKYGAAKFAELLEGSANATEYAINRIKQRYDLDTADGKVGFLREFCTAMAEVPNPVEAEVYTAKTASELEIPHEAISAQIKAIKKAASNKRQKSFENNLKPFTQAIPNQPRDIQRLENSRGAAAEDKLLAIILKNPDYLPKICEKITEQQFVTDFNREIFKVLFQRGQQGKAINVTSLSGELSIQQMSRVSYVLASNEGNSFSLNDAYELIEVVLSTKSKPTDEQVGSMSETELKSFIEKISAGKKLDKNK